MKESTPGPKKNAENSEQLLSPKEAVNVLYWSFYYSQADIPLQKEIMRYIAKKRPQWRIPDTVQTEFTHDAMKKISRFVRRGPHVDVDTEDIGEQKERILEFIEVLNTHNITEREGLVSAESASPEIILKEMIARDSKFLLEGRRGRESLGRESSPQDGPHRKDMSHFISYVLRAERPPGNDVFREMIDDLRTVYADWTTKDPEMLDREAKEALVDAQRLVEAIDSGQIK